MNNLSLVKYVCALILAANTTNGYSQSEKNHFFEAGIHLVGGGVSFEKNFSQNFSIRSSVEYDGSFYFSNNVFTNGTKTVFVLQPAIKIQPRYYYNIEKRQAKNKNTAYNAANFFSAHAAYKSSEINVSNKNYYKPEVLSFGAAWNIRRTIVSSNFVYELSAGFRYDAFTEKFYKSDNGITPELNAKIGYVF